MSEDKTTIQTEPFETTAPPYPPPLPLQLQRYGEAGTKHDNAQGQHRELLEGLRAYAKTIRLPRIGSHKRLSQLREKLTALQHKLSLNISRAIHYIADASSTPYKACVVVGVSVLVMGLILAPFTSLLMLLAAVGTATVQFVVAATLKAKGR